MKHILSNAIFALLLLPVAVHGEIKQIASINFLGNVLASQDISAIAFFDNWLVIGADEGAQIQILDQVTNSIYKAREHSLSLLQGDQEIDVEGMARQDNLLYVIGSHSLKRKEVKPDKTCAENYKRIKSVTAETSRDNIFRLSFDMDTGQVNPDIKAISLRKILSADPVLGPFTRIPGKENGVDIEGIAADNDILYIGFRSPVLRGNYTPIMITSFDNPENYRLVYLHLKGSGIRDITRVKNGFLLIAGPPDEGPGDYRLYFWNGMDGMPDNNTVKAQLTDLGEIASPKKTKPEGITVIEEKLNSYKVIIVYDSAESGNPILLSVKY